MVRIKDCGDDEAWVDDERLTVPYSAQKPVGSKERLVSVAATGFAEALAERENGT